MIFTSKIIIVKFSDVDELSVSLLFEKIFEVLEENKDTRFLIFDFKRVSYVGSSMVSGFISVHNRYEKTDTKITFCNMKPNIKRVFEILKLDKLMNIKNSLIEILQDISEE